MPALNDAEHRYEATYPVPDCCGVEVTGVISGFVIPYESPRYTTRINYYCLVYLLFQSVQVGRQTINTVILSFNFNR